MSRCPSDGRSTAPCQRQGLILGALYAVRSLCCGEYQPQRRVARSGHKKNHLKLYNNSILAGTMPTSTALHSSYHGLTGFYGEAHADSPFSDLAHRMCFLQVKLLHSMRRRLSELPLSNLGYALTVGLKLTYNLS
jgi:hypothetical protein